MTLEIYTGMFSQTILYQVIDFSNFYIKEIKQFVVKNNVNFIVFISIYNMCVY